MKRKDLFVQDLISKMTLDQKVGATLTLGFAGTVPRHHTYDFIEKYHCGGLRLSCKTRVFGSYVDPVTKKELFNVEQQNGIKFRQPAPVCTASEYKAVLNELQERARKRPLGIPLHFSFDEEGGSNGDFQFDGVNLFPKPMGIAASQDPKLAYKIAKAISAQSSAVGFNWIHSPVLDICCEPENPEVCIRSYSDDPKTVAEYAEQSCRGFKECKIIATGKHFPGRGASKSNAHFGMPVIDVDEKTLEERDLVPYKKLIEKDLLPSIMVAHTYYPKIDPEYMSTVSKKIITGILREKLGFEGVITTDSMTMVAVASQYSIPDACARALEAGADLILLKAENKLVGETIARIKEFIAQGRITEEMLDEKVYRILHLKHEYGLFDTQKEDVIPEQIFPRYKELAREAAEKSVLIVRDRDNIFPLKKNERVLVIEQKVNELNNYSWHPGILFEQCMKYSRNVDYQETAFIYDEDDKKGIERLADKYDVLVITAYFQTMKLSNREWLEKFLEECKTKVVLVANNPFEELCIPKNARNVVLTFATSPENIKVTAATLYGMCKPLGQIPVKNGITQEKLNC